MAFDENSGTHRVAEKMGLPTPVPDRWEPMPDEVLEQYILGFERILEDPDLNDDDQVNLVCAFNEHIKPRHKKYFETVADYYQRAEKLTASQLFFTLRKMCGSSVAMVDKMLEVYNTDPRWFKDLFYIHFAEKGSQKHWDVIANDAATEEDVKLLAALAKSRKRQLDKHGVDPWIPELPESAAE